MASNDSTAPESTLPQMLEYLWALVEKNADNGTENGHSNNSYYGDYSQQQLLSRRTRPHMLAYFSPPREERKLNEGEHYLHISREEGAGAELRADHYKHITSAHSLSKVIECNHRIQDVEVMPKGAVADEQMNANAVKSVGEGRREQLQMKANAVKRVDEWRRKHAQLKSMDPEKSSLADRGVAADVVCRKSTLETRAQMKANAVKRVGEWRREQPSVDPGAPVESAVSPLERSFEAVQDLQKLHSSHRENWKANREKWKRERENWKLTCQKLKDDAKAREEQVRKLTVESQRWKAEFAKLATAESEGKVAAEVCTDLLEQLKLEQQHLGLRRRTGDRQSALSTENSNGKQERSSDDKSGSWSAEKWKGEFNQQEVEVRVLQQQLLECQWERQRWQAQCAELKRAESESKKLQEVCRDLLDQQEKQDMEIRCNKVELQKASKWHAQAQQEINEHREEIKRLKSSQVAECIVCMNEFGEDPDAQRAHWKDCNHANICYKCTRTLWDSNNRNCPTCKTPASSKPTQLPPKIYL